MFDGKVNAYKAGYDAARQDFERTLAVLREEVQDLRNERNEQAARADAAADLLLQHLGARAISLAGQQHEERRTERHVQAVERLTAIPDPTEELSYDDPRATYRSAKEAVL